MASPRGCGTPANHSLTPPRDWASAQNGPWKTALHVTMLCAIHPQLNHTATEGNGMANFTSLIKTPRGRRVAIGVAGAATLASAGAFAAVSLGNSGSEIHGCYDKQGRLRLLTSANDTCERNEKAIRWNKEGPVGAQGPMGFMGAAGPAGVDGAVGRDGRDGASGPAGAQGPEGPRGPAGADGSGGGGTPPSSNGVDSFLKIGSINGESTDAKHKDEIEIRSFSWGLSNAGSVSVGGGAGAGKVSFNEIRITKSVDVASAPLALTAATGVHIPDALLTIRKPGSNGEPLEFLKIKLVDVFITSVTQAIDSSSEPAESITLSFAKIDYQYQTDSKAGTGPSIGFSYDIKANKAN